MLIGAALLASVLSATPTYAVAVTRRVGLAQQAGLELAEILSNSLSRQKDKSVGKGISPQAFAATLYAANNPDSAACAGAIVCAIALGKTGGVDRLVALQLVKLGADVAVDARVIDVAAGAVVASTTATMPLRKRQAALDAMAGKLTTKLPPLASPPPTASAPSPLPSPPPPSPTPTPSRDSPVAANVRAKPEAKPRKSGVAVEKPAPARTSPLRYVAVGLGAVAVGAAGFGAWQGVGAMNDAAAASVNPYATAQDLEAVRGRARVADISYAAAGVLAVGALVLWLASPGRPATPASGSIEDGFGAAWSF